MRLRNSMHRSILLGAIQTQGLTLRANAASHMPSIAFAFSKRPTAAFRNGVVIDFVSNQSKIVSDAELVRLMVDNDAALAHRIQNEPRAPNTVWVVCVGHDEASSGAILWNLAAKDGL